MSKKTIMCIDDNIAILEERKKIAINNEDYILAHNTNILLQKVKTIINDIKGIETQKNNAIMNEDYLLANDLLLQLKKLKKTININVKAEAEPEADFEPKTEVQDEAEVQAEANSEDPDKEEVIVLVIEEESEIQDEAEPEPEVQDEAEPEPEPEVQDEAEPEPEVQDEAEPEPEVQDEVEAEPEVQDEIEAEPEPEVQDEEEKQIFMELENKEINKIRSNMKQKDIILIDTIILVLKVIHKIYTSSSILNNQFNTCDFGRIMSNIEEKDNNIKNIKNIKVNTLLNFFAKENNLIFQFDDIKLNLSINMKNHPTIISHTKAPENKTDYHKWYKLTNYGEELLKDFNEHTTFLKLKKSLKYESVISRDKIKKEFITITFENNTKKEYECFTNYNFRTAWEKIPKDKENILDFKDLQSKYLCVCSSCMAGNPHWTNGQYHECGLKCDLDECPEVPEEYKFCVYGPYCNNNDCEWNHLDKSESWINKHFFCNKCIDCNENVSNKFYGLTLQDELSIQTSENNMELTKFKKIIDKTPCSCLNHFKTIFNINKLPPITGCYYGSNCSDINCKYGHGYTMNIHNTIYNHVCIGRMCSDRPQMVNYRGYRKYNNSNIEDGYYCNICNYYNNQELNNPNFIKKSFSENEPELEPELESELEPEPESEFKQSYQESIYTRELRSPVSGQSPKSTTGTEQSIEYIETNIIFDHEYEKKYPALNTHIIQNTPKIKELLKKSNKKKNYKSAVLIQAYFRGYKIRNMLKKQQNNIRIIQNTWRKYSINKLKKEHSKNKKKLDDLKNEHEEYKIIIEQLCNIEKKACITDKFKKVLRTEVELLEILLLKINDAKQKANNKFKNTNLLLTNKSKKKNIQLRPTSPILSPPIFNKSPKLSNECIKNINTITFPIIIE